MSLFHSVLAANYKSLIPCLDQEHISLHHGMHHLEILRAGLTANLHNVENCLLKQSQKITGLPGTERQATNQRQEMKNSLLRDKSSMSNTTLTVPLPNKAAQRHTSQKWQG